MNIIEMMNEAWEDRKTYSHEQNEISFKNLLSHGYVEMDKYYHSINKDYGDTLFLLIQDLLIWFILTDKEFLQGEYDAYAKYCEWADFEPLTSQQCVERYKKLDLEYIIKVVKHISATRGHIPEDDYAAFVTSLCFLSLFGDKEVDKEEYALISCFFTNEDDYCPTWEKFRKEF